MSTSITMTNAVFDDNERNRWLANPKVGTDPRFTAVLRIDPILREFSSRPPSAERMGLRRPSRRSTPNRSKKSKRFLRDWIDRQKAIYLAVSLPPEFRYPAPAENASARAGQTMLEKVILPVCAERNLPFAMMIGCSFR